MRTFRIGPGGWLYPMFTAARWVAGVNTAHCRHLGPDDRQHAAPHPDCTCGFYAYGDDASAGEYPHARHVLAVVSVWGRVIAGTRGVRAEHARVEALWMSRAVPDDLAAAVRGHYPSVRVFADRAEMLRQHSPTPLDCYEPRRPGPASSRHPLARRVAIALCVAAGVVPGAWLTSAPAWQLPLAAACLTLLMRAFVLARRPSGDVDSRRRSLFCVALALWSVTPIAGAAGFLLRLPLLQLAALGRLHAMALRRAARTFPAQIG